MNRVAKPFTGKGNPRPEASFEYDITHDKILLIIDLDNGRSVTNDAQNVLQTIADVERLPSLVGYRVIYRDTLKRWDGMALDETGRFQGLYPIGATDNTARAALAWIRAQAADQATE